MIHSSTKYDAIAARYWWSLFVLVLLLIALSILIGYGFSISQRPSLLNYPLISVVREIRDEATSVQQHIENIASQHVTPNAPVPWQGLEQAILHLEMMVVKPGGDDTSEASVEADHTFLTLLEKLEAHFFYYQASVQEFMGIRGVSLGKTDVEPVHREYAQFLDSLDILETAMKAELNNERRRFRLTVVGLSLFSLLMVGIAGFFFWRFERQQFGVQKMLERSKEKLENQVDLRTQMLESANERLLFEIEEHKLAREELLSYQKQLRQVTSDLLQTQEKERRRIATDIHDRIGQALAVAKIQLSAMQAMLQDTSVISSVDEIRALVTQTIQDTRTLTFELSPPVLYELGLQAAIEWLAETVQKQSGLSVYVTGNQDDERLDTSRRVFLFQAVRELLFNVIKHANTQKVHVQLSNAPGNVTIQVSDDGRGSDILSMASQDTDQHQGFGLFSIREQLRHYGGQLTFESEVGEGVCATIRMPLEIAV